jgi:hypothetical protein
VIVVFGLHSLSVSHPKNLVANHSPQRLHDLRSFARVILAMFPHPSFPLRNEHCTLGSVELKCTTSSLLGAAREVVFVSIAPSLSLSLSLPVSDVAMTASPSRQFFSALTRTVSLPQWQSMYNVGTRKDDSVAEDLPCAFGQSRIQTKCGNGKCAQKQACNQDMCSTRLNVIAYVLVPHSCHHL